MRSRSPEGPEISELLAAAVPTTMNKHRRALIRVQNLQCLLTLVQSIEVLSIHHLFSSSPIPRMSLWRSSATTLTHALISASGTSTSLCLSICRRSRMTTSAPIWTSTGRKPRLSSSERSSLYKIVYGGSQTH